MNIFRPQKPYVFYPPKYSPWVAPLALLLSRSYFLKRQFKVQAVHIEGAEPVASLARDGQSILIAPNHAGHADPHVLSTVGRDYGMRLHYMAAREGFEKHWFYAFVLQRTGAFSVDREGADVASIRTAMKIIRQGRYPLVIFPEGEIYHHHEQLDELNEGVASILLRGAAKIDDDRKCYFIPTGIRYTYDDTVKSTFSQRLDRLEERITWKPRPERDVVERIYRLGGGLLALKEEEFLGRAQTGTLIERIQHLQKRLVEMVEEKHRKGDVGGKLPERVKWLRGKIRRTLTDPDKPLSDEEQRELYDDLDTLFSAVQLYSYPGQYLKEQPTIHRIAETILKLEEDVLGGGTYQAPQEAHISFGEPTEVQAFLDERGLDHKSGVGPLTHHLGEHIQAILDGTQT